MSPRFSLRMLLFITTALAVLIGAKGQLFGLYRYFDPGDVAAQVTYQLQIWRDLPLFVIWAMGLEWVLRRTSVGDPGRNLFIIALAINLIWNFVGQIGLDRALQYLALPQLNVVSIVVLSVDSAIQTTVWALVLLGYVRLYESQPTKISPPPGPFDE